MVVSAPVEGDGIPRKPDRSGTPTSTLIGRKPRSMKARPSGADRKNEDLEEEVTLLVDAKMRRCERSAVNFFYSNHPHPIPTIATAEKKRTHHSVL
jgi:hypothetical protein